MKTFTECLHYAILSADAQQNPSGQWFAVTTDGPIYTGRGQTRLKALHELAHHLHRHYQRSHRNTKKRSIA